MGMRKGSPTHVVGKITIFARPEEQVPVVAHDTIAANPHIDPLKPLGKDRFKCLEVPVLAKDAQPPICTIEYVINIAPEIHPLWPSHVK